MEKYKFKKLAESIRQAIDADEYPIGKQIPSERELAQKHGYSRQTVRKAIGMLCEENVLKPIHGSGNYVLQKTCRPKSGMVAVIASYITLPNFANTLLCIEKTLIDGGYYPLITTTKSRFDAERLAIEDLLQKNVDGLIVERAQSSIPSPNIGFFKQIVAQGIPVVFLNTSFAEIEESVSLSMDNEQGGALCAGHLLSKGHTNFAGVFKTDDQASMERYIGFARHISEKGLILNDSNFVWYTSATMNQLLESFALDCIEKCDSLVCFNDEVAFEFCEVLRRNEVSIPKGFEFVAFDKTEFSERIPHKLTTLEYPQEAIGKLAAKKIMNMIAGKPEKSSRLQWQLFDAKGNMLRPHNKGKD